MSPGPDTASKRAKGIYETPKKCRVEKTGEISRNLPFSRFSSLGSKLTCHHVSTGQFRCRFCVSQFRCRAMAHSPLVKQGIASDRDLPGCNAMLANELMYYITFESKFLSVHPSFLFVVTAIPKSIVAIPNNSILIPFIANTSVTNLKLLVVWNHFSIFI